MADVSELSTPALLVDLDAFEFNLATMSQARPEASLRPHIKAFKSTAIAHRLATAGHRTFCCATIREMEGMAGAGLEHDLLLANEVLDARRLGVLADAGARITVAVDSEETIRAAVGGGVREVLIDVDVGLPRCGCTPEDAGRLADLARSQGLGVRGVMGYEGHLMDMADRDRQAEEVAKCMETLLAAHADVGGDTISAGGTGTYDINGAATEIQAGSYLLMDTHYAAVGLPFREALTVLASIISVNAKGQWAVADAGLKALAMDHGNPGVDTGTVFFCSDEHTTLVDGTWSVGDRVKLRPAHVDPTVAKHQTMWVARGNEVVDQWPVDLRHW
ncbi:MAG: alanine racemase [Acidimicrobiales bacterium]